MLSVAVNEFSCAALKARSSAVVKPATCGADQDNSLRFHCEQVDFTHGRVHWDGRVDADFIQGSMVWANSVGTGRYALQGKRLKYPQITARPL